MQTTANCITKTAARLGAKVIDCETHTFTEATVVHVVAADNRYQEPSGTLHLREQLLEISTASPRIAHSSTTGAHRHEDKTRLRENLREKLGQIFGLLARCVLKLKERINDKRTVHMDIDTTTKGVKHLDPSNAPAILQLMPRRRKRNR